MRYFYIHVTLSGVLLRNILGGNTNDTASRSCTSISRLLALSMPALSEVISTRVNDDGPPEYRVLADELDVAVRDGSLGVAGAIGLEVS